MRVLEDAQVSSGLHSLTGGKAIQEQGYCYKELKGIFTSNDHLAIGLALHAFGDSFAHVQLRNPKGLMYRTGIGHAAELVGKPAGTRCWITSKTSAVTPWMQWSIPGTRPDGPKTRNAMRKRP